MNVNAVEQLYGQFKLYSYKYQFDNAWKTPQLLENFLVTLIKTRSLKRVQLQQKGMFASYFQPLVQVHFENATLYGHFPCFRLVSLHKSFFAHGSEVCKGFSPLLYK